MITIHNYPVSGVMKSATILVFDRVNFRPLTLTSVGWSDQSKIWTMPFARSNIHANCEIVITLADLIAIKSQPKPINFFFFKGWWHLVAFIDHYT